MSARELVISINLKSNEDSNYFLRSLWAELRQTFGKCAWQYSPRKDGEKKRVYFGYIDIGIEATTLGVSISYKQKGVIDKIFIEEVSGTTSKEVKNKIFDSVNQAISRRNNLKNYQFQSTIESNHGAIINYNSLCFKLSVVDSKTNYFLFKTKGFDEFDAATESRKTLVKVLDFLSICTNAAFVPISSSICDEDGDQFKIDNEEVFFDDFDWIDNHPRIGNYLALWKSQKDFVNNVLSGKVRLNHPLLRASSHFNEAQKLLFQNLITNNSPEFSSVLLVSALEVATELYPLESSICKECDQKKYSIRQRVKELVRLHLNQYIEGFIDDYYSARSEYLHTGILFSDTSYIGVSIPQLDPSSNSGCRSQSPTLPINLSEYTGYILRNIFITKNIGNV